MLLVLFFKKIIQVRLFNKANDMTGIYNDKDFITLRNLVPNAKFSCLICSDLQCTNHYEKNTTVFEHDKKEPDWLMHLSCKVCKNEWAICIACNNFKIKLNNNRMISIHRSTYHGKKNKRIRKQVDNKLNDKKKQKIEESTTNIDDAKIEDDKKREEIISNELEKNVKILNEELGKVLTVANVLLPLGTNERTIYFEGDDILASSQIEYDVTIGTSVGDDYTLEINDNNLIINETNIEISNNDETTVTENSINCENVDDDVTATGVITKKMSPINLFNNLQDAMKIKCVVSLL